MKHRQSMFDAVGVDTAGGVLTHCYALLRAVNALLTHCGLRVARGAARGALHVWRVALVTGRNQCLAGYVS